MQVSIQCSLTLQHSCSPNMFVQNVFIDTHDLRFPWVAFFAKRLVFKQYINTVQVFNLPPLSPSPRRIKALQELT